MHKAISVVRGPLDHLGLRDSLITRRSVGYQLLLVDEDLDSLTFRKLVRQSDDARAAHRTDDELNRAETYLAVAARRQGAKADDFVSRLPLIVELVY